jgi:hypothetical protein
LTSCSIFSSHSNGYTDLALSTSFRSQPLGSVRTDEAAALERAGAVADSPARSIPAVRFRRTRLSISSVDGAFGAW